MITYSEYKPAEELSQLIFCYWIFEYNPKPNESGKAEELRHNVLPDGCVSLLFQNSKETGSRRFEAAFLGPTTAIYKTVVPAGNITIGIRFYPGVVDCFFDIDCSKLTNTITDAIPYLKDFDYNSVLQYLKFGLNDFSFLDNFFLKMIKNLRLEPDGIVKRAIDLIIDKEGIIRIHELARELLISERQLERKFKRRTGITPKQFARIRRVRTSVINMLQHDKDFNDTVFDRGYFDQSHFIKDFSLLTGTSPSLLMKYLSQITHHDVK